MPVPSGFMRKRTKAWGRQQRKRARQRVLMKANPPSGKGHGQKSWNGPLVNWRTPPPAASIVMIRK